MKTLTQLLAALPAAAVLRVTGEARVTGPVVESDNELVSGGVFVARRGASVDGHDFIPWAIAQGAAAIIGEHDLRGLSVPYAQVTDAQAALGYLAAAYHDFPARKLTIIGVTGTNGKTTVTSLIHQLLNDAGYKAGMISTVAADLGETTADTGLHVTTPSAPQIQALLAQMVSNGLSYCVLEMTSHGLAQGRLNGIDIDVAVMTNVTHEHLDYHGSFENYRDAKAHMFEMLGTTARKAGQDKIAVINADDPSADIFAAFPADKTVRYGLHKGVLRAYAIDYGAQVTTFTLGEQHYQTPLIGEFNIYNAVAALSTCQALGLDAPSMASSLAGFAGIPGRMERIDMGQDFTAIVDFAHTPDALERAIRAARTLLASDARLTVIFGSAGLRDREKRRMMAEVAAREADFTVLTAEDPRTESLDTILDVMAAACVSQGGVEGKTFIRVPDRGEALYEACQQARPGDIIMACGKGHEQSMCFGTVEYPWDDRDALRAALKGQPLRTLPTAADL